MIVSIINQKGGSGKTTLAINLARYFTKFYPRVLLVDSDPQGSARTWHEKGEGNLIRMVALDKPNVLSKGILELKQDYDWIFIDGVPQISSMTIAAIKCCDLALIPVQPSPYDIWATADTIQFVKDRQENFDGKPKAALVVSRKIVNTNIGREIYKELEKYDLPILQHGTCQRVVYADSASDGLTVLETQAKEAMNEIENIAKEIERFTNDNA
jgi:chromosome partitioning protein